MSRLVSILVALLVAFATAQAVTYDEWIATFPSITNPAPEADPDQDGMANLTEFALADCDPTAPDIASKLPELVFGTRDQGTALPIDDLTVIEYFGQDVPKTGYYYAGLRYKPRANTEGITWLPQYSWWTANLGAWLDGRAAFLPPTEPDGQGRRIRYMAGMFDAETNTKSLFLRLKLVKQ